MVDPAAVGRKLAKQIRYKGPLVTPDFGTAIGIRAICYSSRFSCDWLAELARTNPGIQQNRAKTV